MLTLAFNIQAVNAQGGTIYIRADGSIDPPTAPISTIDNVTYTLTADIFNDSVVIERDNIVVDGAGYTSAGTGSGADGVTIIGRTAVTIENMTISGFRFGIILSFSSGSGLLGNTITGGFEGIRLGESSNNSISGNIGDSSINLYYSSDNCIVGNVITGSYRKGIYLYNSTNNSIVQNVLTATKSGWSIDLQYSSDNDLVNNTISRSDWDGMRVYGSPNNNIVGNTIAANGWADEGRAGIYIESSSGNSIVGNTIFNNSEGIRFSYCSNNNVYHNNFVSNAAQVYSVSSVNVWDDGYPSGGNYWSDYNGTDTDNDGIGDTPYVIDENNTDYYPLINPWTPPDIALAYFATSKTIAKEGSLVTLIMHFENQGNKVEKFARHTYLNGSLLSSENFTLTGGEKLDLPRVWDTTGFAKGNYTVTVLIEPLQGEVDTADNTMTTYVFITIAGDLNGDGVVDIYDAIVLANHFGFHQWYPLWDYNVGINNDGVIDIFDAILLAANYGKSWT
jgi:parallel beta-helix repeat protein